AVPGADGIVAASAEQGVVPPPAEELVVVVATLVGVCALAAFEYLTAVAAGENVTSASTNEPDEFAARRSAAGEGIGTRSAEDVYPADLGGRIRPDPIIAGDIANCDIVRGLVDDNTGRIVVAHDGE